MRNRRAPVVVLVTVVLALFVAGIVWRALNPTASEAPDDDRRILSRQAGYYLCLHRPQLTPGEMYKLVRRKLPNQDQVEALHGCQEAQPR